MFSILSEVLNNLNATVDYYPALVTPSQSTLCSQSVSIQINLNATVGHYPVLVTALQNSLCSPSSLHSNQLKCHCRLISSVSHSIISTVPPPFSFLINLNTVDSYQATVLFTPTQSTPRASVPPPFPFLTECKMAKIV